MKDEYDQETLEVDFNGYDDLHLCPCCKYHSVSDDQMQAQTCGEICTVCNFYEWEEL